MGWTELSIIVIAVIALVTTWHLTRRRYTTRIARLSSALGEAAQRRGLSARPVHSRGDDIETLEQTVNEMFEALASGQRALQQGDSLFRHLADGVQGAILVARDEVIYANPRAAAIRGMRQRDLIGQPVLELFEPGSREKVRALFERQIAGEEVLERVEVQMLNRAETGTWVEASTHRIVYDGEPAVVFTAFDITQRKKVFEVIERERDRASTTLESIADGVVTTDAEGHIDYLNGAAVRLLGCDEAQALGKQLGELVSLVDEGDRKPLRDPVAQALAQRQRVSLGRRALMLAGGEEYSIEVSVAPILDGSELLGAVIVLHDVTELRGLARQMSYQASHDPLTGLINRREFERRLEEALGDVRGSGTGHVVCYMDLDRFKAVNDTCGHMAGDKMLREVASLIRDKVRDSDIVARLGGDEFGMLLLGCPLEKARQIAGDVCQAVEDYRFVWRDRIFQVGISVGLVEIGPESGTIVDALTAADSACYIAKQGRTRVHVYSARDESLARHRGEIAWLQRLQHALKEERFELCVQPIVSAEGNVADGPACEVLVRMLDEKDRAIAPGDFVAAAERYQLMPSIDRWVIRTAFAAIGSGALRLPDNRSCTINLSGQTIGDSTFLEYVVECLDATGVFPDRVCFELTESSVITNIGHARRFIEVLHGMGCQFALDDFGSGVGSLANLRELSMDFIKIHGSFIRNLHEDPVSKAMVNAMIDLARSLGIRVIAEQVEDRNALDAVRAIGVDFVQGYAIGRPRPLLVRDAA